MKARKLLPVGLSCLALAACQANIEDPNGPTSSGDPSRPGLAPIGGGATSGLVDEAAGTDCVPVTPAATTRFFRLTHLQYDQSIRVLTGLTTRPSQDFPADQHQAGFDRGMDLELGDSLGKAYRASAEALARQVVQSPAAWQKVVGCDAAAADACARSFVAQFGRRLFRRPLAEAELTEYLTLFAKAPSLVDGDLSDFAKGVQLVLEALFQSPHFLCRVELSSQASGDSVALNGFEVASRLALLLVNAPPDDILLDAAQNGALGSVEGVTAQAKRLLATSDARTTIADFHRQWLELDTIDNKLAKDPAQFPSVTPDLAPTLRQESQRYIEAVTFDVGKGFRSLFTAPFAFVNQVTAPLYGALGSFGVELQRVELDPAQRAGILTQVAFLASRAYSGKTSPIHRGVFIQRRVLCNTIPDPPAHVPSPPALQPTQTTRQQVEQHTSAPACAGCHQAIINPVGFAFENYDAVGQYRTQENGVTIDASGMLVGTAAAASGQANFQNAIEASALIAESPEARACYAKNWLRYAYGRAEQPADECALAAMAGALASDDYKVTDLMLDLTRTKAFMFRAAGGS